MTIHENQLNEARYRALIDDLRKLPVESPWVEFKENNFDAQVIGKLISALSNSARLADQNFGYVVWGIRNDDHSAVGTTFNPCVQKQNGQPLEFWLSQRLQPDCAISFRSLDYQETKLVLLEIPAASSSPVEFDRQAFIRIGEATPRLADYPDRQKALWTKLQPYSWESGTAVQFLTGDEVLSRLDYTVYFELTAQPLPDNRTGIFDKLLADRIILHDHGGRWNITNLGAILFAKDLKEFPAASRKAIRFVAYNGITRADAVIHRHDEIKGYAKGFQGLLDYIYGLLPHNEHIEKALRVSRPLYPVIAIRELIANALIHQDMTITGAGPLIELFKDRFEITNPGEPLVAPDRFLDSPPRSRNEALASLMRRMGLCEEQGTGIDKVVLACEIFQLPAPKFEKTGQHTKATLFAPKTLAETNKEDRVRACYLHACLKFVSNDKMTNESLRKRFSIEDKNYPMAWRIIKDTQKAGLVKDVDPASKSKKDKKYVPFWA